MDTTITEAGPFERTLTVRVPAADLLQAEERAARRLSRDLKIKGFRPGKAPRKLVESMVGAERIRTEALEEALPGVVARALEENAISPAVAPSVADTRDTLEGLEVDVTVTLWPSPEPLPEFGNRRIVVEGIAVDDEETDEQVERLRHQYAELEEVARAAEPGDYVMIDLAATRDGEPLEEASTADFLYEVGSDSLFDGLDEPLVGSSAGDVHVVETDLPPHRFGEAAGPAELRVLVKGVRAKRLPEVTDEWVSDVTEFDTVAELRDHLAGRLGDLKVAQAGSELRTRLLDELIDEMELDIPEALVVAEMDSAAHRFAHRLEQQGLDLATYFEVTGQAQDAFIEDLRTQADRNLRSRILLDAVVDAEGIEVDAEEVSSTIAQFAEAARQPADEYQRQFQESGQVQALVGDMLRQKALDLMAERATAVDGDGNVVVLTSGPDTGMTSGEDDETDDDGGTVPAEVIA